MTNKDYNKAVDDFSNSIFRFLLKNTKDEDKANDLVQDAFEKLWINRKNVDTQKVKSYIFSTAYHAFIDMIRREKKMAQWDNSATNNCSHNEQYSDLQEILHEAIEQLPCEQRSVVLLRDYEGYSYKEISEITLLSESQVKVYIYRARQFLKTYIGSIEAVV